MQQTHNNLEKNVWWLPVTIREMIFEYPFCDNFCDNFIFYSHIIFYFIYIDLVFVQIPTFLFYFYKLWLSHKLSIKKLFK